MARVANSEYTFVSEATLTGTGLGTSPEVVASFLDLQRAVYQDQPEDTAAAQAAAEAAAVQAGTAQDAADSAQTAADSAGERADDAQTRADAAYALAETKVAKSVGPVFAAPSATPNRNALPIYAGGAAGATYTQSDVQALMDQVAALTSRVAALIMDGRANRSLTN